MIVEENIKERSHLRSSFEQHGCTVIEASNGLEGLAHAIHHQPDIIISNTLMPRMDGFQLLWALKSDPKLTSIPFLFYSDTHTGDQETKLALSLGASAFIVKKNNPEEIWEQASAVALSGKPTHKARVYPAIEKSDKKLLWQYSRIIASKLEEKVRELQEAASKRKRDADELSSLSDELFRTNSERQRAEIVVKEQEQLIKAIFETAPCITLLLDGDQRILKASSSVRLISGQPAFSQTGQQQSGDILRCLHALDSPDGCGFGAHCRECALRIALVHTLDTGQRHEGIEVTLPLVVNGRTKQATLVISTSRVTLPNREMVLVNIQDITERKNLEFSLRQARKAEPLAFLTSGIVEELNNLLTSMLGYGDIALMQTPTDTPAHQSVKHMLEATQTTAALTKNLITHIRKLSGEKNNTDLNELIASRHSTLSDAIGRHIPFAIKTCDQPLPVCADAHQIELLIALLAANARHTAPNNGSITSA